MRRHALGWMLLLAACRPTALGQSARETGRVGPEGSSPRSPERVRIETDEGFAVALDADAGRLLTLSLASTVRLWDLRSGRLIHTWPAVEQDRRFFGYAIGHSPNGRWATVSQRPATFVQLFDLRSGTVEEIPGEDYVLAISNDAKHVVRFEERTVRIAALENDRTVAEFTTERELRGAVFSDDGERVYIHDSHGGSLWSVAEGKRLAGFNPWWDRDKLLPTMPEIVVASGTPCEAWNTKDGVKLRSFPGSARCLSLAHTPTGSRVALYMREPDGGRLEVWSPTGKSNLLTKTLPDVVTDVELDDSGRWVAATGGESFVWDVDHPNASPQNLPTGLAVAFSPKADQIAVSGSSETRVLRRDGGVVVRSSQDGDPTFALDGTRLAITNDGVYAPSELWALDPPRQIGFVGGGSTTRLVRIRRDGQILMADTHHGHTYWSLETGERVGQCPAPKFLKDHAWLDDETIIRVQSDERTVTFDAVNWKSCRPVQIHLPLEAESAPTLLARPRAPGILLAFGGTDDAVVLPGQPALRLAEESYGRAAWNASGSHLVRAHYPAPLVTTVNGQQVGELGFVPVERGADDVLALAPDASVVAGMSGDQIVLYDVATGKVLEEYDLSEFVAMPGRPQRDLEDESQIDFSPDGKRLAARTVFGQFAVFDLATGDTVAERMDNASAFAWRPETGELAVATFLPDQRQEVNVYAGKALRRADTLRTHWERVRHLEYAAGRLVVVGERIIDVMQR